MKIKNILLAFLCLQINLKAQVSYQGNPNFTRVFQEDFNGTNGIDTNKWLIRHYENNETRTYVTPRVENLEQSDGMLKLRCKGEYIPAAPNSFFTGGEIHCKSPSYNNFFIESVFTLPFAPKIVSGMFFIGGYTLKGPPVCSWKEFDFLEHRPIFGVDAHITNNIHYCETDSTEKVVVSGKRDFFVYNQLLPHMIQARWSKYMMTYLDNVEKAKQVNPELGDFNGAKTLIVNYWVRHNPLADYYDAFPTQSEIALINESVYKVDYIYAFTLAMDCSNAVTNFTNFSWGVKKSYAISSLPSSYQGTRVSFLATDFIQFNPGFEVNLGTDLEAGIIECD